MLLSSWRSCIHLPSFRQVQPHNYNRKEASISRIQWQQHTWRIQVVLLAWQIPSVISWTKRIVSSRSKGLMRKRQQIWLIHRALVRRLNQTSAFFHSPFYKLNTDKRWRQWKSEKKEKEALKLFSRKGFKDAVYAASTKENYKNLFLFIIIYQKKNWWQRAFWFRIWMHNRVSH